MVKTIAEICCLAIKGKTVVDMLFLNSLPLLIANLSCRPLLLMSPVVPTES